MCGNTPVRDSVSDIHDLRQNLAPLRTIQVEPTHVEKTSMGQSIQIVLL